MKITLRELVALLWFFVAALNVMLSDHAAKEHQLEASAIFWLTATVSAIYACELSRTYKTKETEGTK